jgi:NAD(P)-dependent dehydrogenase (short-subunit alcohol dehydrogenase family)
MTDASYASLKGRPVFISGGATGIGEALVRGFAAQGAIVAFVDLAQAEGTALEAELRAAGQKAHFARCDITDVNAYKAEIARLAAITGPFRVLVNNAANDQRHKLEDVTSEYFDQRVAVNLKHQLFAVQAVAPGMMAAGGGSIINLGSISWMVPQGGFPVYAACKAAIHGLTRTLARDLGKSSIRVNTLVPGWVMTKRQLDLWVTPEGEKQMDDNQCLAGRVMPDDIAHMALFLASEDSAKITAQEFIVDAGWI